ncbi:MAG: hypothetical protein LBI74_07740 [Synergistaceae bacterium]|jgi:hypothetical protein|nr:hypothetical protein [Synergistaceae bacterium]
MIKRLMFLFAVMAAATIASTACAADTTVDGDTSLRGLARVENFVYGQPQSGGLLLRLSKVERDLFGMELPGSLTERQDALVSFVELGNANQPSFIFKIGVAEWVTLRRVNTSQPFGERIMNLENTLEGDNQEGALSVRLERVLSKLLPSGVSSLPAQVPSGTVFRAKFVETLTVRNVKQGDIIQLELDEDYIADGALAAAKGNRVFAQVTKVRMPRSFGRAAEISVEFNDVEFIGGETTPVLIGPESKKASTLDKGVIGAAGASLAGAVLLGPVGLAGGFLVRGSDRQIPEGTLIYVETAEFKDVSGYQISGHTEETEGDSPEAPASDLPPSDTLTPVTYQ